MKKNMGDADRIIRAVIAFAVAILYYFEVIDGTLAYVLLAISAVFLLTSFISFCPLYSIFSIKTCKIIE